MKRSILTFTRAIGQVIADMCLPSTPLPLIFLIVACFILFMTMLLTPSNKVVETKNLGSPVSARFIGGNIFEDDKTEIKLVESQFIVYGAMQIDFSKSMKLEEFSDGRRRLCQDKDSSCKNLVE